MGGWAPNYEIVTDSIDADVALLAGLRNHRSKMLATVAELCGATLPEMTGDRQSQYLTRKRWRMFYLLRRLDYSYPVIGKFMNKHHATVLNGVRQVESAIAAQMKAAAE